MSSPTPYDIDLALQTLKSYTDHPDELTPDELHLLSCNASDGSESDRLLQLAVEKGNPLAMVESAIKIMQIAGENAPGAQTLITKAAGKGEAESVFNVGIQMIVSGEDPQGGEKMIERSAAMGYGPAWIQMAHFERNRNNTADSKLFILNALDAKAAEPEQLTGTFFDKNDLDSNGVIDRKKIIENCKSSSHPAIQFTVWEAMVKDKDSSPDKALKHLTSAYKGGWLPAMAMAFRLHIPGCQNAGERFKLLEKAAVLNYTELLPDYARALWKGDGCTADPQKAVENVELALCFLHPEGLRLALEMIDDGIIPDLKNQARLIIYRTTLQNITDTNSNKTEL